MGLGLRCRRIRWKFSYSEKFPRTNGLGYLPRMPIHELPHDQEPTIVADDDGAAWKASKPASETQCVDVQIVGWFV